MVFDEPSDFEPDEPDPEEQLDFDVLDSDPEFDVQIPSGENAPAELKRTFWGMVLLIKIGVTAGSIGALLLLLSPYTRAGAAGLVVGLFAFGHAYLKYRRSEYS